MLLTVFLALTLGFALLAQPGCAETNLTWHQKFEWKAEEYFDDAQVIALCKAIEANDLEEMERLIQEGANVNAKGKGNMTPLMWAYPDNKPQRLEPLLEAGADPNVLFKSDFGTGLASINWASVTHLAAGTEFPKHFDLVFEHGGDPNLVRHSTLGFGETPIFAVIKSSCDDKLRRIRILIDKGANLDHVSDCTPTIQAVGWGGQYDIALALLKAGASPSVYQTDGLMQLAHVVVREERRLPTMNPQQKADYAALVKWLTTNGVSIDEAREDLDRWASWVGTPKQIKAMREREIRERKQREKAAAEEEKGKAEDDSPATESKATD